MTKNKKLVLNTYVALLYQLIAVVCGFILPRYIIPYFGSATNGMINSISQFLSIITLCECGVGAVVQAALYKPLAQGDYTELSKIIVSSNRFFNAIMRILVGYVVILIPIFIIVIGKEYDYSILYIGTLIIILAVNYIAQYYLYLTYRLLLNADQLSYIQLSIHSVVVILNTVLTILLIKMGASVHTVKLLSALIYLIQPIFLKHYVDKNYKIDWSVKLVEEPIKQKWNGMAQHIANVILDNTDTVVLTVFSSLENVSIYGVYYLVVHGIRQVIVSFSTGIQSLLGNMYANNDVELDTTFTRIEIVFHWLVTFLYSITGIMIISFVKIYTRNFTDANYIRPLFAFFMVLAQGAYCIRIPYETMIRAAGHFRETQKSSIVEAAINIIISTTFIIIFPSDFKLISVALGTLIAMLYRTTYLVFYLTENILHRKMILFIKSIFLDVVVAIIIVMFGSCLPNKDLSVIKWVICACVCTVVSLVISGSLFYVMYRREFIKSIKMFIK